VSSLFDLDLSTTLSIQGPYRDLLVSDTLWLSSHSLVKNSILLTS
jgi:hypothetical protein